MSRDAMKLLEAAGWATYWHRDQKRKYTGMPYVMHSLAVAKQVLNLRYMVRELADEALANDMAVAAILHDVLEDCPLVTPDNLKSLFGRRVMVLVMALTDTFTKEAYPEMNRASRKRAERALLGAHGIEVQFIKACDLLDNLADIAEHDADFAKVYIEECEATAAVLTKLPPIFRDHIASKIKAAKEQMT